jgi:Uma2 family endonuclease
MSTTASAPKIAEPEPASSDRLYRLTVDQYHQMARAGILGEDDPVELLEGLLVTKMTKNERHILAVKLIFRVLDRAVPAGWHVSKEDPVSVSLYNEPEPDLAVVRGGPRDYADRKPGPADLALLVEVSDTTYATDQRKLLIYARAGILVYWIVNLPLERVEVYTEPTVAEGLPSYGSCRNYGPGDEVPLTLDGREVARFTVRDLLP